MTISAASVKELRDRTGAGMMECKKALQESNGDIDKAIENMRKAGQAKADKKSDRVAAEGTITIQSSTDGHSAAIVEINSETDFAARDEHFLAFTKAVTQVALSTKIEDVEKLLSETIGSNESVEVARQHLISKIGENIKLRRVRVLSSNNTIGSYLHGSRIGVLVELEGSDSVMAKDIAMHIAASKPMVISIEDVSKDLLDKEREIFKAQAQDSGKPEDIIEKMVEGRLNKFVSEISLTGQSFVKNPDTTVGQLLKDNGASVISFVRFEVGEGIEKETVDFASEVAAQINA